MSKKSAVLVLVILVCQQCLAAEFSQNTVDKLSHLQERLTVPEVGPVIGLLINGLHDIVSDTDASSALEASLDETLKITQNQKLINLFDYMIASFTMALETPHVRQILLRRLTLTNEVFHKDAAKNFITKGIQVSYRVMTDRAVLKSFRQITRAATRILTDPQAQRTISTLLLKSLSIITDPEALNDVQRSIRAVNHILSSEKARASIMTAVNQMQIGAALLTANQARRFGNMQNRLASQSASPFNLFS